MQPPTCFLAYYQSGGWSNCRNTKVGLFTGKNAGVCHCFPNLKHPSTITEEFWGRCIYINMDATSCVSWRHSHVLAITICMYPRFPSLHGWYPKTTCSIVANLLDHTVLVCVNYCKSIEMPTNNVAQFSVSIIHNNPIWGSANFLWTSETEFSLSDRMANRKYGDGYGTSHVWLTALWPFESILHQGWLKRNTHIFGGIDLFSYFSWFNQSFLIGWILYLWNFGSAQIPHLFRRRCFLAMVARHRYVTSLLLFVR